MGSFIREFWQFLKVRKKLWLFPFMVILLLLAILLIAAQVTPLTPFLYTLF